MGRLVGRRGALGSLLLLRRLRRCRRSDQLTRPRDGLGLGAAGQQTVVPDPVEPVWQDVDEEPADELARLERHGLVAAGSLDPVVLVAERDAGRVGGDEPAVGDRDPVGVAGQIGQHLLGPGERPLAIDEPLGLVQRSQIGCEGSRIIEVGVGAEERQASGAVGCEQLVQEQSPEQAREHRCCQEELWAARYPALAVERDAAAGHDHVHMRVMRHRRAPGVQHGDEPDPSAQVLGVGRDRGHGLGRCREQEIVDHGLVLIGDVGDLRRQREHDVIIRHG